VAIAPLSNFGNPFQKPDPLISLFVPFVACVPFLESLQKGTKEIQNNGEIDCACSGEELI